MLNLRFKYIVITSLFFVLHNIPKANKMIRYWDRYTDEEREKMACKIIDHMKRRGRTVTDLYGMKNITINMLIFLTGGYDNHGGEKFLGGLCAAVSRFCCAYVDSCKNRHFKC